MKIQEKQHKRKANDLGDHAVKKKLKKRARMAEKIEKKEISKKEIKKKQEEINKTEDQDSDSVSTDSDNCLSCFLGF